MRHKASISRRKKKRVVFKCIFHQNPDNVKSKGTGARGIQHYQALNCQFKIRANLNEKKKYEITQLCGEHSHDLIKDDFLMHPNQRKLT